MVSRLPRIRTVQVVVKPVNKLWALVLPTMVQLVKMGLVIPAAGLAAGQLYPPPLLFHMCYTSTQLHGHAIPIHTRSTLCSLDGAIELFHVCRTPYLPLGLIACRFHLQTSARTALCLSAFVRTAVSRTRRRVVFIQPRVPYSTTYTRPVLCGVAAGVPLRSI